VLAGLTCELRFHQEKHLWIHPANLALHQAHLSHFTNVTTLVFVNLVTSPFHAVSLEDCFGSFARSVRHLRLHHPVTRPSSLMHCVLLFSAAVDIEIVHPRWAVVSEREDSPSRLPENAGFTGTLHLRGFSGPWLKFFELLSAQSLRFQRILLVGGNFQSSVPVQSLLVATAHYVRTLHLIAVSNRESNSISLMRKGLTGACRTPPLKPYTSRLPCSRKPCTQNTRGRH